VAQAYWHRLCLRHWHKQAGCTKPVPLGLGEVKINLSLCHGTSHIPPSGHSLCHGTSSIPRRSLYLFHLCQLVTKSGSTRPWNCSSDLRGRGMLSRSLGPMILVFCPVHDTHMKLVRTRVLMVTARDKQMRDQSSPRGRGSR